MVRVTPPRRLTRETASSPLDSPSRQLLRDLENLQLYEAEIKKVIAYQRRSFYEELDRRDLERAQHDAAALGAVHARRESLRLEAEAVLQAHILDEEKARKVREEEARKKVEVEARKIEAEEQARAEAAAVARRKKEEEDARERAEKERIAEEEAAKAAAKAAAARNAEEQAAKEAAELAARKAAEEAAARAEAARKAELASTVEEQNRTEQPAPSASPGAANEAIHTRYLEIHKRLKAFRAGFWKQAKADKGLSSKVGEMRRGLRIAVGQLTEGKNTNTKPTQRVKGIFEVALTLPSPSVDIRHFLARQPPPSSSDADTTYSVPSLVIYTLSIFAKAVVSQFTTESAVSTHTAEPTGILVAQILSLDTLRLAPSPPPPTDGATKGSTYSYPLVDILLAKLHAACPVLFGVSGPESTAEGRLRLGWRRENGAFVPEQTHYDRMTGVAAGFAALTLRNFSKTRLANPLPPTHFWAAVANLVNVAPACAQPTHLVVLRALMENAADRTVLFFGGAGVALLRCALVEWPASLPPQLRASPACVAIGLLVETWAKDKNFRLV